MNTSLRKRTIGLFLAIAMIVIVFPVSHISANAADTVTKKLQNVSLGGSHSAVIKKDGSLWMWGKNDRGQIGDGTTTDVTTPKKILSDVASISLGGYHSAAIKKDGSLWMWGMNTGYGQIGDGTSTDVTTPKNVLSDVVIVSLGDTHSAAIKKDGSLWMWGSNSFGEIGDGTNTNVTTPKRILSDVVSVSLGGHYSAAIKKDGSLWMWGLNNTYGQIGDGTTNSNVTTPKKVLSDVASVSLGDTHSAAIKKDGSLWMWGSNWSGEIGDGTTTDVTTPKKILSDVVSVRLGDTVSAAIKKDGSLWMWGNNWFGEIGDGTTNNVTTPKKVLSDVVSASLGDTHSAAIKKDGSLWLWGRNDHGQIGDGTTAGVKTPKQIMESGTINANNIDEEDKNELWFQLSSYDVEYGKDQIVYATFRSTRTITNSDLVWKVSNDDLKIKNVEVYDLSTNVDGGGNSDRLWSISAVCNSNIEGTYEISLSIKNGPTAKTIFKNFKNPDNQSSNSEGYTLKDGWPVKNTRVAFGYSPDYTIPISRAGIFSSYDPLKNLGAAAIHTRFFRFGWGGNCHGMSLLSASNYLGTINLKDYSNQKKGSKLSEYAYEKIKTDSSGKQFFALEGNEDLIRIIETAHLSQFSDEFANTEILKNDSNYSNLLALIRASSNPIIVSIEGVFAFQDGTTERGGHTLVIDTSIAPKDLDETELGKKWGKGWIGLNLYDPNAPQGGAALEKPVDYYSRSAYLYLNTIDGSWKFYGVDKDSEIIYYTNNSYKNGNHRTIQFYDPSKLNESYYTGKLHASAINALFVTRNISFKSESSHLITIENNEVTKLNSSTDYKVYCGLDGDDNDGTLRYMSLPQKTIEYSTSNADVFLQNNNWNNYFYLSSNGQSTINVDYDTTKVKLEADETTTASIGIGIKNQFILLKDETIKKGSSVEIEVNKDNHIIIDLDGNKLGELNLYQDGKAISYSSEEDDNEAEITPNTIDNNTDDETASSKKDESIVPSSAKYQYSDVPSGKWYTDAVYYCRDKGYMAGKANNRFDPNGKVTRATITQVLYAMEGKPAVKKTTGFKDLKSGSWYVDSVNWAASIGIVSGYSKDKFGPNDAITRQQMAAIMYQYAKYKKYDTSANGDISKFEDSKSITEYAETPMKWAVGHGIISGTNKGLEPKGTATRAQIAVILQAFDKNVRK